MRRRMQAPWSIIDIDDPRDVSGNPNANPLTRAGNLTTGSTTLSGTDRREDRYQVQETLSYVRGPSHIALWSRRASHPLALVDLEDASGTFNFASPADFLASKPSQYRHRFNTESEQRNTYTGIFAQDDWRLRPNLMLAFGLRWDNETILDDRNNLGPRLAIAWDPFKSGKTAVRAGYGIFFNRALLRTLDDFILTSNTILVDTDNTAAKPLLTQLQFPHVLAANDPRIAQLGVLESGFVRRLGSGFRIPESYQASLGIEREIGRGFKVEVNYVFNRGLHPVERVERKRCAIASRFLRFHFLFALTRFQQRARSSDGSAPHHHRRQRRCRALQSEHDEQRDGQRRHQDDCRLRTE